MADERPGPGDRGRCAVRRGRAKRRLAARRRGGVRCSQYRAQAAAALRDAAARDPHLRRRLVLRLAADARDHQGDRQRLPDPRLLDARRRNIDRLGREHGAGPAAGALAGHRAAAASAARRVPRPVRLRRTLLVALLAALAPFPALAETGGAGAPAEAGIGHFAVGVRVLRYVDGSRLTRPRDRQPVTRVLPVVLRYPSTGAAAGREAY